MTRVYYIHRLAYPSADWLWEYIPNAQVNQFIDKLINTGHICRIKH